MFCTGLSLVVSLLSVSFFSCLMLNLTTICFYIATPLLLLFVVLYLKCKLKIDFDFKEGAKLKENLARLELENQNLTKQINQLNIKTTELETRLETLDEVKDKSSYLEAENLKLSKDKTFLETKLKAAEDYFEKRGQEQAKLEEAFLQKAKASILEISEGMIKSSVEINHEFANQAQEVTKQTTKDLLEKFETTVKNLEVVKEIASGTKSDIDAIKNIFKNSNSTGLQGEAILINTLQDLGFTEGRDYISQFNARKEGGGSDKPDAIVYLNGGKDLMVIDSKSSMYFLNTELEEVERDKKIKQSMETHIKTLSSKSYIESVKEEVYKTKGTKPDKVHLFMFLPSEDCIRVVLRAYPSFYSDAVSKNIYICGPITLHYALDIAKRGLQNHYINENYAKIIEEVKILIERTARLTKYADDIVVKYNQMADSIGNFRSSFDARIIPQHSKISKLLAKTDKSIQISDVQISQENSKPLELFDKQG